MKCQALQVKISSAEVVINILKVKMCQCKPSNFNHAISLFDPQLIDLLCDKIRFVSRKKEKL